MSDTEARDQRPVARPDAVDAGQGEDGAKLTADAQKLWRTFLTVWFGQLISLVGSPLTWFGSSVWVFLETGSVTDLSLMLLASNLPRDLLSPVAGALVDRWDRRWVMILSDGASGLGTIVIALAFSTDSMSLGATGMLVGSIFASACKGTSRRVLGIIASTVVFGVMLMVIGVSTWLLSIVVALWLGMSAMPLAQAMTQSIWLAKVEPDVQGRVFSIRSMIASGTAPIALALAGPLADRVFVPLMTGDSSLGTALQGWLGSGEAAAYGLFFVTMGLYKVIMALLSWLCGPCATSSVTSLMRMNFRSQLLPMVRTSHKTM